MMVLCYQNYSSVLEQILAEMVGTDLLDSGPEAKCQDFLSHSEVHLLCGQHILRLK